MNNSFNSENVSSQLIHQILENARSSGREDFVARTLVSAHLEVHHASSMTRSSESDDPSALLINDTVFHVTAAPSPHLYERCKANLQNGYRVFILVPERLLIDVRQYVTAVLPGKITVAAVEIFLSQSIEYSAAFSKGEIFSGFRRLLDMYNQRVAALTSDTSMLIEMPRTLQ